MVDNAGEAPLRRCIFDEESLDPRHAQLRDACGAVVQAIGVVSTLTQSEDAAVFHADMLLRVFDRAARAIEVLEPWEGSERVDVRLAALRGETGGDESKLSCDSCRYSDRTVATFYFMVARATHGHPNEKLELAKFYLSAADSELVDGRLLGQDHARAFELFRELADAGDPRGMFWVGGLLLREDASQYDDVPIDLPTGWAYLNAAASFGYGPAIESLRDVPERLWHLRATDQTAADIEATTVESQLPDANTVIAGHHSDGTSAAASQRASVGCRDAVGPANALAHVPLQLRAFQFARH